MKPVLDTGAGGYRLESFENVLGRDLTDGFQPVMPPGTEARRSEADELEAWLDVVAEGSVHPDTQGVQAVAAMVINSK